MGMGLGVCGGAIVGSIVAVGSGVLEGAGVPSGSGGVLTGTAEDVRLESVESSVCAKLACVSTMATAASCTNVSAIFRISLTRESQRSGSMRRRRLGLRDNEIQAGLRILLSLRTYEFEKISTTGYSVALAMTASQLAPSEIRARGLNRRCS